MTTVTTGRRGPAPARVLLQMPVVTPHGRLTNFQADRQITRGNGAPKQQGIPMLAFDRRSRVVGSPPVPKEPFRS